MALSHCVDDGFSGRTESALNHYAVSLAKEAAILISGLQNLSSPTRTISDLPAATLLKTGGKCRERFLLPGLSLRDPRPRPFQAFSVNAWVRAISTSAPRDLGGLYKDSSGVI